MKTAVCLAVALAAAAPPAIRALEITLPPETIFLKPSPLPGYGLAGAFCGTCHSADYIRYQPPGEPRAFWEAEVLKMRKAYGAPIPAQFVDPIADYLEKTYGAGAGKARPAKE